MTLTELEQLVPEWQQVWRLQDWRIKVEFVNPEGLPEPDLQAHSEWNENSQDATVRILAEEYFDAEKFMNPFDPEQTLLHEMGHIRFCTVDRQNCPSFEFAIDATADALLALKRR